MPYTLIVPILDELESTLRSLSLWQHTAPTEQALASEQPFALDTLAAHEWLQWIFLPRMQQLIALQAPLPKLALTPYFEEALQEELQRTQLLPLLRLLDRYAQLAAD